MMKKILNRVFQFASVLLLTNGVCLVAEGVMDGRYWMRLLGVCLVAAAFSLWWRD